MTYSITSSSISPVGALVETAPIAEPTFRAPNQQQMSAGLAGLGNPLHSPVEIQLGSQMVQLPTRQESLFVLRLTVVSHLGHSYVTHKVTLTSSMPAEWVERDGEVFLPDEMPFNLSTISTECSSTGQKDTAGQMHVMVNDSYNAPTDRTVVTPAALASSAMIHDTWAGEGYQEDIVDVGSIPCSCPVTVKETLPTTWGASLVNAYNQSAAITGLATAHGTMAHMPPPSMTNGITQWLCPHHTMAKGETTWGYLNGLAGGMLSSNTSFIMGDGDWLMTDIEHIDSWDTKYAQRDIGYEIMTYIRVLMQNMRIDSLSVALTPSINILGETTVEMSPLLGAYSMTGATANQHTWDVVKNSLGSWVSSIMVRNGTTDFAVSMRMTLGTPGWIEVVLDGQRMAFTTPDHVLGYTTPNTTSNANYAQNLTPGLNGLAKLMSQSRTADFY